MVSLSIDLDTHTVADTIMQFGKALRTATTPKHTAVVWDQGMRQDLERIAAVLEMMAEFANAREL